MCAVSYIGDTWRNDFPVRYTTVWPYVNNTPPSVEFSVLSAEVENLKVEMKKLNAEMEVLKKLLGSAKEFDEITGQPDCEVDEKVELIKKVAKMVGVEINL